MSRVVLSGMSGANPLGFLASVGLLRVVSKAFETARLGFLDDGSYRPFIEGVDTPLEELVLADASAAGSAWMIATADGLTAGSLKVSPEEFDHFVRAAISSWLQGGLEPAEYAAGYASARCSNEPLDVTAFHFIAGQQQFLAIVDAVRRLVSRDWVHESLFVRSANRTGKGHANLRWDPAANRNRSLMASNPSELGTEVDAPREWLAFRAIPLFPTLPVGSGLRTTGFRRSSSETVFSWPLWREAASLRSVSGLLRLRPTIDLSRGVFATAASQLIRNGYYRNFGPGSVSA